jgi:predicted Fe-S protein YdhL (DUF1289 family)
VADPLRPDVVASPCIGTCKLDALQMCVGCGRTIQEIGAWFRASNEERRAIVVAAELRRRANAGAS